MRPPLLAWIDAHHPRARETLRPACDEAAVAEARLPEALAALYRAHDGQDPGPMASALFEEAFRWLPVAEGRAARERATRVLDEVRVELPEAEPFAPSWLPIGEDDLGNLLVVDVELDEVFVHLHDEGRSAGEAPSAAAFLDTYLESLESGGLVIDAELGVVERARPPTAVTPPPAPPIRWGVVAVIFLALAAFALFVVWSETSR